jgi:mitogen-activated protein kinase kinase kinase
MVTVSIAECQDGVEILEKVLRKFGKLGSEGRFEADESVDGDDGLSIDGWGVFLAGAGEEGPGEFRLAFAGVVDADMLFPTS